LKEKEAMIQNNPIPNSLTQIRNKIEIPTGNLQTQDTPTYIPPTLQIEIIHTKKNMKKCGRKKNDINSVEYSGEVNSAKPELIFT
jgi:hypothetical protein